MECIDHLEVVLLKIFGTDGVRGVAISDLTVDLAMKIGKAVARIFAPNGGKILIGKDTRISSSSLESALSAGITSCGVNSVILGVLPTPGVAYLTRISESNAGIMISASHNSFEFNGIKIFNSDGFKISEKDQENIEDLIEKGVNDFPFVGSENVGIVKHDKYFVNQYTNYLRQILKSTSLKVVFDCANGSASSCVGKVFKDIINFEYICDSPNGTNINQNCGSTCLASFSHYVVKNRFDLGISFDGDADRCLAIDRNGEVIDGDHIMAAISLDMKNDSNLRGNTVVGTMMSNMGFEDFLNSHGINFIRANIGDRFVAEEMRKNDFSIGGEQSGHIIFSDYSTTGDAILTSIMLINLVSRIRDSSKISKMFNQYPQFVKNLKVRGEESVLERAKFKELISRLEEIISDSGRVFVRKSGTEPVLRIMCESRDREKLNEAEGEISRFESSFGW